MTIYEANIVPYTLLDDFFSHERCCVQSLLPGCMLSKEYSFSCAIVASVLDIVQSFHAIKSKPRRK